MPLTNQDKPTTSLVNPTKVVGYETWDSNTSTWDTETRNWNEMGTIWSNVSKKEILKSLTCYLKLDETSGSPIDFVTGDAFINTTVDPNLFPIAVTYDTGLINNCGVFNNIGFLTAPYDRQLLSASGFSVSFWIYLTGTISNDAVVDDRYNFSIRLSSGKLRVLLLNNGTPYITKTSTSDIPLDSWVHVVCTVSSTDGINIYVNNTLTDSFAGAVTINNTSCTIRFGAARTTGTLQLTGKMDEIGVFNTVLIPKEVTYLFNSNSGIQPPYSSNFSFLTNINKP